MHGKRDILITGKDGKLLSQDEIALMGIGGTFELTGDIEIKVGNFDTAFETLALSASEHDGVYELICDGNVSDQFRPNGYNAFDYDYSPVLDITADQAGYEDCFTSEIDRSAFDKEGLYQKMVENNCHILEITITLTFNDAVTTDDAKEWKKTISVTRPLID